MQIHFINQTVLKIKKILKIIQTKKRFHNTASANLRKGN